MKLLDTFLRIFGDGVPAASLEVEIENIVPGSELHLGDKRVLAFGERAMVTVSLARLLIKRGQAK